MQSLLSKVKPHIRRSKPKFGPKDFICSYANIRLDPPARLTLGSRPQLFGVLPSSSFGDGARWAGILCITGPNEAQLRFILGSRYREDVVHDSKRLVGVGFIPRPGEEEDEALLCIRMRQCGALWVDGWYTAFSRSQENNTYQAPGPLQEVEKHVLGYPSSGGVWIFDIPKEVWRCDYNDGCARDDPGDLEGTFQWHEEHGEELHRIDSIRDQIETQSDMDGVCKILQEAGATYYPDTQDCPKLASLGIDCTQPSFDVLPNG